MKSGNVFTIILAVGLLLVLTIFIQALSESLMMAGNNEGFEPVQPIAYSHRLHAGELGIDCKSCHIGVEESRNAGFPPANACMNCHRFITAPFNEVREEDEKATAEQRSPRRLVSPELKKLYAALALDETMKPDPSKEPSPIAWVKIHNLPDYVYFDHRGHVLSGVECQTCHGQVQTMERVRQVSDLSMGWCVNCHRESNNKGVRGKSVRAPLECSACHF